jgi:hypothetical protein
MISKRHIGAGAGRMEMFRRVLAKALRAVEPADAAESLFLLPVTTWRIRMRGEAAATKIGLCPSPCIGRRETQRLALAIALLFSAPAFAEPASKDERVLFCKTIDKGLEEEAADMALDMKACLANASIASNAISDGKREIKGKLGFRAPGRPAFTLSCAATYAPPLTKKSVATLGTCG